MGRRSLGVVFGLVAGVILVLAGYYNAALIGGFPVFIILIAAAAFFAEGGFSNLAPYTVEQYGVSLGSRSSGLGQAANGVGKILGPLALALLAGSDNIIAPKRDGRGGLLLAFVFLGGTMLAVALAFLFLGVETHGRKQIVAGPYRRRIRRVALDGGSACRDGGAPWPVDSVDKNKVGTSARLGKMLADPSSARDDPQWQAASTR